MNPRRAVTLVFFADGAMFASWVSRIPALSGRVHAGPGVLGLILLTPAVAALLAIPIAGRFLARGSSRTLCRGALTALMVAIVLPGLARTSWGLAGALLLLGAANATLDVSMNSQGVTVERHLEKPILSSLHAAFSFGGFAGAGAGALAAALHASPLPHLLIASAVFGIPAMIATAWSHGDDNDPDAAAPTLGWRALPRRLILLGAAAFFALLAEGAAADWGAKLVRGEPAGTAALGALAYAAFSIGMAAGRLAADALWKRWGTGVLVRRGIALAVTGITLGLIAGTAPAGITGFLILGLGLSGVVPTLFRTAAQQDGVAAGAALAAVTSLGYAGFLAGPPLIGGVAQLTSLRLACGLLPVSAVIVALLAARSSSPTKTPQTAPQGALT